MSKKILIPVHTGFEETELISTLNVLKRNNIEYTLWSIEGLAIVKSSHEALVQTITEFPATEEFDGIFFHGGPAHLEMMNYDEVLHLARTYASEDKVVSAICGAPAILKKAGVLEGKRYTANPGKAEGPGNTHRTVEVDGKLVTGKDYKATIEFAEILSEVIINN